MNLGFSINQNALRKQNCQPKAFKLLSISSINLYPLSIKIPHWLVSASVSNA